MAIAIAEPNTSVLFLRLLGHYLSGQLERIWTWPWTSGRVDKTAVFLSASVTTAYMIAGVVGGPVRWGVHRVSRNFSLQQNVQGVGNLLLPVVVFFLRGVTIFTF